MTTITSASRSGRAGEPAKFQPYASPAVGTPPFPVWSTPCRPNPTWVSEACRASATRVGYAAVPSAQSEVLTSQSAITPRVMESP
ncbi:hypothetical protein PV333_00455 [Streptomyces sp. NY05-11A]|nr:hypothetical protein [Streptomyces sp. NY05-11A]MDX2674949.1 hypothetical protein [Streptomyces sp. NY05-11A]